MSPRFPACSKGGLIPTEPIGWCPGGSGGRVALGFDFAYTPRGMLWGPAGDPTKWMIMCHQTTCRACKKATWAGCGQHQQQVMRGIPKNERCTCTAAEKAAAKGGFFARIFGG